MQILTAVLVNLHSVINHSPEKPGKDPHHTTSVDQALVSDLDIVRV